MLEDSEVFRDAAFEDKNEITSDGVMPEQGKVPLEHHVDNGERQSTMKKVRELHLIVVRLNSRFCFRPGFGGLQQEP